MSGYFDKDGKAISFARYITLRAEDSEYYRVALTDVGGGFHVSTVWLGINHNFFGGKPLIFETMVYFLPAEGDPTFDDNFQRRYSTVEEARLGHAEAVELARQKRLNP